ncbi:MAG: FecR domain-containing protein [Leptospiraceae bacterium]|nr:FecR domain-containing protein [Leptospiraceae bacterium]MCB1303354.1 FecR domain-containing protein [Leptospiraceae bacterium]
MRLFTIQNGGRLLLGAILGFSLAFCSQGDNQNVKGQNEGKPVARITFLSGDVQVKQGDQQATASQGQILTTGAELTTGSGASVELFFKDLGIVRVGADSQVSVDSIASNEVNLGLKSGNAGVFLKKMRSDDTFSVHTPTSVAAVRGTAFLVTVDSAEQSRVALFDGAIEVSDQDGQSVVMDQKGEITVKKGQKITGADVQPLSQEALARMKDMAVFEKNRILEYNTFLDELNDSKWMEDLQVESSVSEKMDNLDNQANRPADRVVKAQRAEENVIRRDTEGDPLKIPAKKDFK